MANNKMQKAIGQLGSLFAASSLLLGISACSDFLEIKPQSEIILEDFWNEKADVDNIVNGCYSRMQGDDVMRRMIIWGEGRTDNISAGINIENDGSLQDIVNENITTKNAYTAWDGFYSVINRCNTVIKYAPGVAESDPGYTQSELKATIAEVSALRDLCYFYLIRTFRNVPYTTMAYTDDDQQLALPPTDFNVVLDSLINDLESIQSNAIGRYPTNHPEYQTGRITKCAIWAMLCEMYLWKGDWDNCIRYADLVIQDKKDLLQERRSEGYSMSGAQSSATETRFNGFPLTSNQTTGSFYGRFYNDIYVNGNNQETIFELVFDNDNAGNSMLGNSAVGLLYGNATVDKGLLAPSTTVVEDVGKVSSRAIYADRNKKMDARFYMNSDNDAQAIYKFVYRGIQIDASSSEPKTSSGIYSKYNYARISNVDHYYNSSNWIVYRLTDIMLLKAEAICQKMVEGTGDDVSAVNAPLLAQAFSLVNAVNKRAVMQTTLIDTLLASNYTTKAQMEELVLRERQCELMFEGKRWYDLVRRSLRDGNTNVLSQAMTRREGTNSQYVQNFFGSSTTGLDAIFLPYNDTETKVNPYLAAAQNPAFGSGEGNISK